MRKVGLANNRKNICHNLTLKWLMFKFFFYIFQICFSSTQNAVLKLWRSNTEYIAPGEWEKNPNYRNVSNYFFSMKRIFHTYRILHFKSKTKHAPRIAHIILSSATTLLDIQSWKRWYKEKTFVIIPEIIMSSM